MKYNFEFNINDKATNAGIYRNISLEKAKNNWITFANGDDYFIDGLYNKVSKYSNKELNTYFFLLQASIQTQEKQQIDTWHLKKLLKVT